LVESFYDWPEAVPMWRMVLPAGQFQPVEGDCVALGVDDAAELEALYALGGGPAFSPRQLEAGAFWGLRVAGSLLAAAGTHLVSVTYGVGAIGNVFTHPGHRGQGYGTATTSAVVEDLMAQGIEAIVLNVGQENRAGVRVYEKLGFERYCPFWEGAAEIR
jgi:ribosomal protein S18 acetylase RimI-like enzyme